MRYVHTNLIAKDWRKLSSFYQKVFGCRPIGPQRDLSGEWLEKLTGIKGAKIVGEHLEMPGFNEKSPTLEVFSYTEGIDVDKQINAYGFSHIAFEVTDVKQTAELLQNEGGSLLGEIVTKDYGELGMATFVYAKDPEGNFIELQSREI